MIGVILSILALSALIIAAFFDIKTKEIPNWLTYTFISLAITINLLYSILQNNYEFILKSILGFAFFFLVGNIMYFTQQWGGGDTKLVMGLGASLYSYPIFLLNYFSPNLTIPFIFALFINILIIGALYSISWSVYLIYKNFNQFTDGLKTKIKKTKNLQKIILSLVLLIIILSFITNVGYYLIIFAFFIIILFYLIISVKTIDEICMYKIAPIKKLTEGDWVPKPIYHKGKIIIRSKAEGLTLKDISLLKKLKIKKILIREGIPFVPSLLISFIITILFGLLIPLS